MNSVERVMAALRRDEPDRVPIIELEIHEGVKPEDYLAMIRATKEFGRYPISI